MSTLKKHGLERFDPSIEGEKFDPNLHDAAFMTKVEGRPDGSVFETIQKGFLLNGRVVRVSFVVVCNEPIVRQIEADEMFHRLQRLGL